MMEYGTLGVLQRLATYWVLCHADERVKALTVEALEYLEYICLYLWIHVRLGNWALVGRNGWPGQLKYIQY